MSANVRIRFGLHIVLVCLYSTPSHHHHCANLSEGIELKNAYQIHFVECVSKIKHILCFIHYTISRAVCFQFTHFSCDDWENIYILCLTIIIKSEVWTISHCLGLGHKTMVSAVCLSIFLWICDMAGLLRGTFVSWWYLPRILPSVTDMQYYYHARYPTDDWHLAYICFHGYIFLWKCVWKACFPILLAHDEIPASGSMPRSRWLPLTKKKQHRTGVGWGGSGGGGCCWWGVVGGGGGAALLLNQARGHLNWRMGQPALLGGNLGCRIVYFPLILRSLWGVS